ncbi:MAG: CsbD family protein [Paraburkholderia nemoris]
MDRNRVEGAAKQVKGSVREAIGKVTGNRTTQASGAAEKLTGKVQSKVGKFADAVRARVKW